MSLSAVEFPISNVKFERADSERSGVSPSVRGFSLRFCTGKLTPAARQRGRLKPVLQRLRGDAESAAGQPVNDLAAGLGQR